MSIVWVRGWGSEVQSPHHSAMLLLGVVVTLGKQTLALSSDHSTSEYLAGGLARRVFSHKPRDQRGGQARRLNEYVTQHSVVVLTASRKSRAVRLTG